MMKKILTMFIAGTMFFGMTACGNNSTSSEITDEARTKIFDSMNELNQIFNVEEGK